MNSAEISARFEGLLVLLGLEFAQDEAVPRFVIPTESGGGITAEFSPLGDDVCVSLIHPLLYGVDMPGLTGYRLLADQQPHLLLAKLSYDRKQAVVELRNDLLLGDLTAESLAMALGALSQHSVIAERMQAEFGGTFGPGYEELITGE